MFKNVFDKFDDFDVDRVVEVVNLVWNNRDRIMHLVQSLPQMLLETGDQIESAGQSAVKASLFLTGDTKSGGKGVSAGQISELAAAALERCCVEMMETAQMIEHMGVELDKIRIPSIDLEYTKVMGIDIVKGVNVGESQLVDNVANRLQQGSGRLTDIGHDLKNVAGHLRHLGGALTETGGDLNNVGLQLQNSGSKLRSFAQIDSFSDMINKKDKSKTDKKKNQWESDSWSQDL